VTVPGAWLGIDVGSSKSKIANLCLIEIGDDGRTQVLFERGQARVCKGEKPWPANLATSFLDLDRVTWVCEAVETTVHRILERSVLAGRWRSRLRSTTARCGAAVDAPCGFAVAGYDRRDTEVHAADSFLTCD
jgi:hypothetical protein